MNRRNFLKGSIAAVLAAAGLGGADATDASDREFYGGETAPTGCGQCQNLQEFQERVETENVPNTEYERHVLKEAVDPEGHSWEGDCVYTEVPQYVVHNFKDEDFTAEDVQEMDYDLHVTHSPHVVDVDVTFDTGLPLRAIETTITVGEVDG